MADQKDRVLSWLNDAYAMEQSITQVLENHAKDAKDHPQVQGRIQQHLEETRRHGDLVKGRIESLGGDTSSIKSGMANISGKFQGASTGMADDEMVKNALADYSTEYFEMASYKALKTAAETLGDQETVRVCDQIIQEEQRMADWLEQQLPTVVQEDLQHVASQ